MPHLTKTRVRRLFRRGLKHAALGAFDKAVAAFNKARRRDPRCPFYPMHLALALCELGRCGEALDAAALAVELAPGSAAIHIFAGRVLYDARDFDGARARFDAALRLSPENDLARGYRVLADWADGDPNAWRRIEPDQLPDSTPFLVRWLQQIEMAMRPEMTAPGPPRRDTPQPGRARERAKPVRTLDRLRLAWRLWRGRAALKAGDIEKAGFHLELMEEIAPDHPATKAFLRSLQQEAFAQAARRAVEDPHLPEVRCAYALALLDEERPDAAAAESRAALRLATAAKAPQPLLKALWRTAGKIAFERGHYARALDLLNRGEEPGFELTELQYYRGLALMALGDLPAARRELAHVVAQAHWAVPLRQRELRDKQSPRPAECQEKPTP